MSKEKLEVGDVWKHKESNIKIVVLRHENYYTDVLGFMEVGDGGTYFTSQYYDNDSFLRRFNYLGKAKANINNLFEVVND
jgi:hypothetical protein